VIISDIVVVVCSLFMTRIRMWTMKTMMMVMMKLMRRKMMKKRKNATMTTLRLQYETLIFTRF